ncbi:MAG: DNA-3-methyladenine glycosylase [Planctomycetes bacterium]|nr:DNA-3-methyladenine glycosylase [Planctomycetota bacterium]
MTVHESDFEPLTAEFFNRPPELLAPALLGFRLCRDGVTLEITEVEAYGGPDDSASHARTGPTARNRPMWGAGGLVYVFLCYGMHRMLNLVSGPEGVPGAILIRSARLHEGAARVTERRGPVRRDWLTGPGKVGQALDVHLAMSGRSLLGPAGLELRAGPPITRILSGPRIGIDYATASDRRRAWRFATGDGCAVARPKELRPWSAHR